MIDALLKKIFGTKHERDVKRMMPTVVAINAFEPSLQPLDEAGLRAKSDEFRKRLAGSETVDEVLSEAFAVCREAARRTVGMRHFDVQLIGGMVLHAGTIAEMATGEGKTLVATLPAYLNALIGSGPADESTDRYFKIDRIIPKLRRAATIVEGKLSEIEAEMKGDFIVDEKARAVALTEEGIASCERLLNVDNLYDPHHMTALHHIQQALRAHALFRRDADYIVK